MNWDSISELLGGLLIDAGQVGGYTINFRAANEEAVPPTKRGIISCGIKNKRRVI